MLRVVTQLLWCSRRSCFGESCCHGPDCCLSVCFLAPLVQKLMLERIAALRLSPCLAFDCTCVCRPSSLAQCLMTIRCGDIPVPVKTVGVKSAKPLAICAVSFSCLAHLAEMATADRKRPVYSQKIVNLVVPALHSTLLLFTTRDHCSIGDR